MNNDLDLATQIPYPKEKPSLPQVLSREELTLLFDSCLNSKHRVHVCNPIIQFSYVYITILYIKYKMISKSLIAASSRPLILGILRSGKSYGYLILQKVKELSGGVLEWSDGMLYPVLHRLEKEGLILSEWIISEEGRPRKYYSITEKGKNELFKEKEQWMNVHMALNKIWMAINCQDNG